MFCDRVDSERGNGYEKNNGKIFRSYFTLLSNNNWRALVKC